MTDRVALARLAPDALGTLGQAGLAVLGEGEDGAVLGQVYCHVRLLRREEGFHVGGIAAILARRNEQVLLPRHPEFLRGGSVEARGRERNSLLAKRPRHLPPPDLMALLGAVRF